MHEEPDARWSNPVAYPIDPQNVPAVNLLNKHWTTQVLVGAVWVFPVVVGFLAQPMLGAIFAVISGAQFWAFVGHPHLLITRHRDAMCAAISRQIESPFTDFHLDVLQQARAMHEHTDQTYFFGGGWQRVKMVVQEGPRPVLHVSIVEAITR